MKAVEYIGVIAGKSGDAIVKEIHKWGKHTAIVCGKDNENGIEWSEKSLICDLANKEKVLNYFRTLSIKRVVFGTGHILALELAEYLKLNGIKINIIPEISFLCNNKYELKKIINDIGLLTPNFYRITDNNNLYKELENAVKLIGLPCVLKSIKDIVAPQLIWNMEELYQESQVLLSKEPSIMIEEYIKGNDCTAVVVNSGENAKCIYATPWSKANDDELKGFVKTIQESLSKSMLNSISEVVEKLVNKVNVLGVCRVDFIINNNNIYILEINSLISSSILEGSEYTIKNFINHVNLSKIIVESAMFNLYKDSDNKPCRTEEKTIFVNSEDERNIQGLLPGMKVAVVKDDEIILYYSENGKIGHYNYELIKNIYTYKGNFNIEIMIKSFIRENDYNPLSENHFRKIILFAGFILAQNSEIYSNELTGNDREYLDLALAFLNRKEF